jgi:trans-2-enoyl-CoA reductase
MADPLSERDVINILNNWWEDEVKPELEAINSTLQDILTQHTVIASETKTIASETKTIASETKTIASEIETIDTAIQKIRDLADHPSGPGIRTTSPYSYLGNAILYQLYVKQGQALADPELDSAGQAESLNKINEMISELSSNLDPNQSGFG